MDDERDKEEVQEDVEEPSQRYNIFDRSVLQPIAGFQYKGTVAGFLLCQNGSIDRFLFTNLYDARLVFCQSHMDRVV